MTVDAWMITPKTDEEIYTKALKPGMDRSVAVSVIAEYHKTSVT